MAITNSRLKNKTMTYIWDTNILLYSLRKPEFLNDIKLRYALDDLLSAVSISAVTVGEIHAISLRNRWGQKRRTALAELLALLKKVSVTDDDFLIQMYSEIDVYSQGHHPSLRMTGSARKMGKNDLWIAATTAAAQCTLVSTDNDFTHLSGLFFFFEKIVA
jgi:tRNA(fMet)-specific endonuclease VapC